MENKLNIITITRKDYDFLKHEEFLLEQIKDEIYELIKNAELNFYKDDLLFNVSEVNKFIKSKFKFDYDYRFHELKDREEN